MSASTSQWPGDSAPPVGYLSRKALPIKRNDAEPLTRVDVQYDLLNCIFSDQQAVFTSQETAVTSRVTFRDLYITALYNSSKCSKVLKDKMVETPAFAIELAKISLLTNVGRINTTMAFFPEMKTALRTYHPVPSLQKTDGNAQDAPRIKNCLKAALLPSEFKSIPPSTPDEILEKLRAGQHPPTSVVNLVFVLANHAAPLASVHFNGSLNFLDLFIPSNFASNDRTRTFLWLMYHYLEDPKEPNPFSDIYAVRNLGKAPLIRQLTHAETGYENVDTPDELAWGARMSSQRNAFLQRLVSATENERKGKYYPSHDPPAAPPPPPQAPVASTSQRKGRSHRQGHESRRDRDDGPFMYYVPQREQSDPPAAQPVRAEPPPPPPAAPQYTQPRPREQRTMLHHAWHKIMTTDPLADDTDEVEDEHARVDYTRRLSVLSRLLGGRSPTS